MTPLNNPRLLPRYSLENERGVASERYERVQGVYFIFWKDDLLYIGKSNNIQVRIREHYRKSWYLKEMRIAHIEEHDEDARTFLELWFLRHFRPTKNYYF